MQTNNESEKDRLDKGRFIFKASMRT